MVSFAPVSPPRPYTPPSPHPYAPHAQPISLFSILSPAQYWVNIAYKVLSYILYVRLSVYTERIIGRYQCGFRKWKSTTNQIFTLSRIMEKTVEYQIAVHHLFTGFKSAYDSIYRETLFSAMMGFGIAPKLITMVRTTMTNVQCSVRIQSHLSEPISTTCGVRHGGTLACLLFDTALGKVIRDWWRSN